MSSPAEPPSHEMAPGAVKPEACWVYPDTNVFMHFRAIDELPFAQIVRAKEPVTVVLTPSVIDELDSQKVKHPNTDLRDRAKQVVARLREWRQSGRTTLPNGARLMFRALRHGKDLRALGLDDGIRDDHLLAEILSERELRGGRHVLLTADFGPELRAGSLQIEAMTPPDEFRLPVPDATEKELRRTKEELQKQLARTPALALRFLGGGPHHRFVVQRPAQLTDADVMRMVEAEERARMMDVPAELFGNEIFGRAFLLMNPLNSVGPSVAAVQRYNEDVRKYLTEYEDYLRHCWLSDDELRARTLQIRLELGNDGTATASTVRVEILAPPEAAFAADAPAGHSQPNAPARPRSSLDLAPSTFSNSAFRAFELPVQPNIRGPWLSDDGPPAVTFRIDTALHKKAYSLPPFYLIYPTVGAIRPVTLRTSIVSDELPDWSEGTLHVVVDLADTPTGGPLGPERSAS